MTNHNRGTVSLHMIALLISAVAVAQGVEGQARTPSAVTGNDRFAYVFNCAGQYIRIDLATGEHSQLSGVPGIAPGSAGFDGCLVERIVAEPQRSLIYVLIPKESFVDSLGQRQEKVVALQLPSLTVLGSVDIPVLTDQRSKLRQDTATHALFVGCRMPQSSAGNGVISLEYEILTENPKELVLQQRQGTAAPALANSGPLHSDHAFVDASGTIVDGSTIFAPNGAVSSIDGNGLITDSLMAKFQSLARTAPNAKSYLDAVIVDAAGGRMLFIIGWDMASRPSEAGGGLLIYDALNHQVLSSILTPFREAADELAPGTPTAHLTPDGRMAVVEEYQWRAADATAASPMKERFKTGQIALYDSTSGRRVGLVQVDPAPGFAGRVVGFSSDSRFMYYASEQDVYVVDLTNATARTVSLPNSFLPIAVITADR